MLERIAFHHLGGFRSAIRKQRTKNNKQRTKGCLNISINGKNLFSFPIYFQRPNLARYLNVLISAETSCLAPVEQLIPLSQPLDPIRSDLVRTRRGRRLPLFLSPLFAPTSARVRTRAANGPVSYFNFDFNFNNTSSMHKQLLLALFSPLPHSKLSRFIPSREN